MITPILMFPGAARPRSPISNIDGEDIRPILQRAADAAGIPLELILAGAIAESGLNPRAERWGTRTGEATTAINRGDWAKLQAIISDVWPDVSFGYSQRIVLYHWAGDRTATVANCMTVRAQVATYPGRDLLEMAGHLGSCLERVEGEDLSSVSGDPLLAALVVYNAGHYPDPIAEAWWWQRWMGNVAGYRAALGQARSVT